MSKTTSDSITLYLSDIKGSIASAIIEACGEDSPLESGVVGPSFACSGPGSGWQRNFDSDDYARRALGHEYGAVGYVDADDGRLATLDEDGNLEWTERSVVEVIAPNLSEVDDNLESIKLIIDALDSGQCVEGRYDWDYIRALVEVSRQDALEHIDGEIVGGSVVYYADETSRWYVHPAEELLRLRIIMGSSDEDIARDAYSHWCAECANGDGYSTYEDALQSIK